MDFASGLTNLQKAAQSSSSASNDNVNYRRGENFKKRGSDSLSNYNADGNNRNNHNQRYSKRHDSRSRLSRDEEWIRKNLQSLKPYNAKSVNIEAEPTCHLVLLFLTIDDLPFEHIWRAWMEDFDSKNEWKCPMKVSVLCHAKFPYKVKSKWLQKRLLRRHHKYHSYRPEWGSVEITRGMIDLLYDGLHVNELNVNETNNSDSPPVEPDRFLFLSESCLPIHSLHYFYETLYLPTKKDKTKNKHYGKSWINARNSPNNGYSRQLQFDRVSQAIPQSKVWKADQWMLLTRNHAEAIVKNNLPSALSRCVPLWTMFKYVKASDEIYFPTAFALLGIFIDSTNNDNVESDEKMSESIGEEVIKKRVTYCDWSGGDKNPVSFKGIRQLREVAMQAKSNGCLIARKFVPLDEKSNSQKKDTPITIDEWMKIIETGN